MKKFDSATKYQIKTWVFSATCVVLVFLALRNASFFLGIASKLVGIIMPFFIGFGIAFVLNGPLKLVENRLLVGMNKDKRGKKFKRPVALVITYFLLLVLICFVMSLIVPQIVASVSALINNLPAYLAQLQQAIVMLTEQYGISGNIFESFVGTWEDFLMQVGTFISTALPQVMSITMSITSGVSNIFIGLIVSVYMLAGKERFSAQLQRLLGAYLPELHRDRALRLGNIAYTTFNGFISGQLLDACIVGVLCFTGMNLLPMSPDINTYMVLISTIIAITNIIPIFGPYIGAVPCTFIILMVDFKSAVWFIAMIVAIQMVDGNIILPKIVGDSIGLSGFWVMFAILLGGGLFGIAGMVLGIPTFATVYKVLQIITAKRIALKHSQEEPLPEE